MKYNSYNKTHEAKNSKNDTINLDDNNDEQFNFETSNQKGFDGDFDDAYNNYTDSNEESNYIYYDGEENECEDDNISKLNPSLIGEDSDADTSTDSYEPDINISYPKTKYKISKLFMRLLVLILFVTFIGLKINQTNIIGLTTNTIRNHYNQPRFLSPNRPNSELVEKVYIDWWNKYIDECCLSEGAEKADCSADKKCLYIIRGLIGEYDQTINESPWLNKCCYGYKTLGTDFYDVKSYCSFSCLNTERINSLPLIK